MPKFVCLIRGPIRPDVLSVARNIDILQRSLSRSRYCIDYYICTWLDDQLSANKVGDLLKDVNIWTMQLPSTPFTDVEIGGSVDGYFFKKINCYKQHVAAISFINRALQMGKYDYIIHTRTDLRIEIDLNEWIDTSRYVTISCGKSENGNWLETHSGVTNDQFAVATATAMRNTWDYGEDDDLIRMINKVKYAEMILDMNMCRNSVRVITARPLLWELDSNRHMNNDR